MTSLLERADRGEPQSRDHAERMLQTILTTTYFYAPRRAMDADRPDVAAALLRVARRIDPERADICLSLARAEAERGRVPEAMESLRCAVRLGIRDPDRYVRDPGLERLRDEPAFRALLDRLRGGTTPTAGERSRAVVPIR